MLNLIDEFTHECLSIRVDRKLMSTDVIDMLSDQFILHGVPEHIRSDNGPEFVAVDFEWQELDRVLAAAGFAAGKRAQVIWEGVTNYLTAEAVDGALRWVATLAESSRLIFTYVDAGLINGSDRFGDAAAARRAA